MSEEQRSRFVPARLALSDSGGQLEPARMHQHQPLKAVCENLNLNQYILATDDTDRIVGVVARERILERLETPNVQERERWANMPISSLMNVAIAGPQPGTVGNQLDGDIECVAISEDDGLVGIALKDDIFLRWSRLEPMLHLATSDPLTGLMNRLGYDRRLFEEWHRATRTGTSVGILLADLDKLKHLNDCYGHQAGDAVLNGIANLLEMTLRSYDVVARYGGDEFVALCLGCDIGEMAIPLKRIQEQIANTNFAFGGRSLPVSISLGAAVRHDGFSNQSPSDLFRAADDCLYRAKTNESITSYVVEYGVHCNQTAYPVYHTNHQSPVA